MQIEPAFLSYGLPVHRLSKEYLRLHGRVQVFCGQLRNLGNGAIALLESSLGARETDAATLGYRTGIAFAVEQNRRSQRSYSVRLTDGSNRFFSVRLAAGSRPNTSQPACGHGRRCSPLPAGRDRDSDRPCSRTACPVRSTDQQVLR